MQTLFNYLKILNVRITSKSATRIDLIFTNVKHLLECGTIVNTISDHEAVYLIKKKIKEANVLMNMLKSVVIRITTSFNFRRKLSWINIGMNSILPMM